MGKLWIAAAALFCWPAAMDAWAAQPIKPADPCELAGQVAAALVTGASRELLIFDEQPFQGARIVSPVLRTAPPRDIPGELVERWDAGLESSLLGACPLVRPAISSVVRIATADDRKRADGIKHGPSLLQISAPLVSRSGEHLLIEVRSRCGGLCGSGEVLHFRRTAKGWVRMSPAARYIS